MSQIIHSFGVLSKNVQKCCLYQTFMITHFIVKGCGVIHSLYLWPFLQMEKYQSLSFLLTEQPSLCRWFLLNQSSHLNRSLSADQRIFSEVVIRFKVKNFKLFQKENLRMILYIYQPLKYTHWINWHISGYQNFYEKLGVTNNFIYDIISWWGMWSFTKIRLLLLSTFK